MLKLDTITVSLEKARHINRPLLSDISFSAYPSEIVMILGHNGAGKSTLFNVISGTMAPSKGKIFLNEKDITPTSSYERAQNISIVQQDPRAGTMGNMTILENMAFALRRGDKRGLSFFITSQKKAFIKEKLSLAGIGLENRLDHKVSDLSGGQRQILSLIMAIAKESDILLLDEITAALDPVMSQSIMRLLRQIIHPKMIFLMITHDLKQALTYGDRVILLKEGRCLNDYPLTEQSKLTVPDLMKQFD
jgi:putative ABC transport system ATP-binding protein